MRITTSMLSVLTQMKYWDVDSSIFANVAFDPNIKHKILDVYVTPLPVESKLIVRYVDIDTGEDIKTEEVKVKY